MHIGRKIDVFLLDVISDGIVFKHYPAPGSFTQFKISRIDIGFGRISQIGTQIGFGNCF
ncbi:hypothetical protein D3C87_2086970 [compost metagenome]